MMAAEKKSGTSPDEIETQANILYINISHNYL